MEPHDPWQPRDPEESRETHRDWWENFGCPADPKLGWSTRGAGERYETRRWKNQRRRERDGRLVRSLLSQRLARPDGRSVLVLDAPCGTGRLRGMLQGFGRYVGVDISASMLEEARALEPATLLRGDVEHLPFRDGSFSVVVCCRLLHHLRDRERLVQTVSELVRVGSHWIAASFFDARSLPALKRRLLRAGGPARIAHPKSVIREAFEAAGAPVVGWKHSLRFFSQQTFVLAWKESS